MTSTQQATSASINRPALNRKDAIEKAAELVRVKGVVKITGTDYWSRIDAKLNLDYEIRRDSCTCPSWQYKNAGREFQAPCVHQIAVFGSAMALFIVEMRAASSISELMTIVERYAEAVKLALPEFRAMADHEYQLALVRVEQEQSEKESEQKPEQPKEVPEILRKPQPKSVRYEGWEI
jgi:hypothetical protein